jgi:hypothetical protein
LIPDAVKPWMRIALTFGLDEWATRRALAQLADSELHEVEQGIAIHAKQYPKTLRRLQLEPVEAQGGFWVGKIKPLLEKELEKRKKRRGDGRHPNTRPY